MTLGNSIVSFRRRKNNKHGSTIKNIKRQILGELGTKLLKVKESSSTRLPKDYITDLLNEAKESGVTVTKPMLQRAVLNLRQNPNYYTTTSSPEKSITNAANPQEGNSPPTTNAESEPHTVTPPKPTW